MNKLGVIAAVAAAGLVLAWMVSPFYKVDQGQRGVVLSFGAYKTIAEPGLNFYIPGINSVVLIPTQSQKRTYGESEGEFAAYSKDQQSANIRLSVNYRADPARVGSLYEQYGSLEGAVARLIDPKIYEETKNVFGQFNAAIAVQERARLNATIEKAVRDGVGDGPVIIDSVQIEDIAFSAAYEDSIEARMLAEVEVEKIRQNAAREKINADIAVTQAKGRADSALAEAQAAAQAIRLRGDAEAEAIKARAQALANNPLLIQLTTAERWDGVLPTSIPPGGTVPFLNVSPQGQ